MGGEIAVLGIGIDFWVAFAIGVGEAFVLWPAFALTDGGIEGESGITCHAVARFFLFAVSRVGIACRPRRALDVFAKIRGNGVADARVWIACRIGGAFGVFAQVRVIGGTQTRAWVAHGAVRTRIFGASIGRLGLAHARGLVTHGAMCARRLRAFLRVRNTLAEFLAARASGGTPDVFARRVFSAVIAAAKSHDAKGA